MTDYHFLVLARAIHVLGVVLWIGGVAFVTTVLIPSLRRMPDRKNRFEMFEALEGRFALQARVVTLLTALSGLYMLYVLDGWSRYLDPSFWWMHLMTFVWLLFSLVLYVLEPAFLHRWFRELAARDSDRAFFWLHAMHRVLLVVSLIAILGAIAGSRGLRMFPIKEGRSILNPDRITVLRDFATRYTEAWCSQDPASVAAFFSPDGSLTINEGAPAVGRMAITEAARGFMTTFPDLVVSMDELAEEDGRIIYRWTLEGTNDGPGGTGHRVRVSGFEEWEIGDDGLIRKSLGHFDAAEYQRQVDGLDS